MGVILSEIKRGSANQIWLDRFKQAHLKIRDNETVTLTEFTPLTATRVQLRAPQEVSERDIARFIGKPVVKGEKTALYTFSGKPRSVEILDVTPATVAVIDTTD